jgi:hypothetical protein
VTVLLSAKKKCLQRNHAASEMKLAQKHLRKHETMMHLELNETMMQLQKGMRKHGVCETKMQWGVYSRR